MSDDRAAAPKIPGDSGEWCWFNDVTHLSQGQ